jgi:ribosome recycling factor
VVVLLIQIANHQRFTTFQPVNAFAHQFNNADVDSFGMTLPANVLSMSERLVFQISMPGATKLVIAFADSNQLANVKLSL